MSWTPDGGLNYFLTRAFSLMEPNYQIESWSRGFRKCTHLLLKNPLSLNNWGCLYTEKKSGAKMAPPWNRFGKRCHFVFSLIIMYLNGGHPVDMKMAPLWSHFGSTFFFQCRHVRIFVGTPVGVLHQIAEALWVPTTK